jgi:DNA primase
MTYALTGPIEDLLKQPIPERSVNAMVHCPFHEDRTPSFGIHLDEGVWHCFSCDRSGTLNKLYRLLDTEVDLNVRLNQAKRNAEAPQVRVTNFGPLANSHTDAFRAGRDSGFGKEFAKPRGIRKSSLVAFNVGYDSGRDALTFPYQDNEGRVTGIKYRYRTGFKASETGSHYDVYGLDEAIGKQRVIICEGESDTLRVHTQYGDRYGVCGTSGASVSDAQWSSIGLHLLFARRIYLLYDADEAGDKCVETAMRVLGSDKCVRIRPQDGMDATEFLQSGHQLEEIGLE